MARLVTGRLRGIRVILAAIVLATTAGLAGAEGYGNDSRGVLYRVRPRQGDVVRVGQVLVGEGESRVAPQLTDIALSPKHGMYAISFGTLYQVPLEDPGKSRVVGDLGVSLNALAFDADDNLFGAGAGGLYRVDRKTGRARRIGAFGVGDGADGDLVFIERELWATISSSSGVLLSRLDPATGRAVESRHVKRADGTTVGSIWGLSYDGQQLMGLSPDGEVLALDRKESTARLLFRANVSFWGGAVPLRL